MTPDEQLQLERDNWIETAKQHCRNEEYYRGLVTQIGKMFGKEAHMSDDGTIQQDILCAKVPELVKKLIVDYFIVCRDIGV